MCRCSRRRLWCRLLDLLCRWDIGLEKCGVYVWVRIVRVEVLQATGRVLLPLVEPKARGINPFTKHEHVYGLTILLLLVLGLLSCDQVVHHSFLCSGIASQEVAGRPAMRPWAHRAGWYEVGSSGATAIRILLGIIVVGGRHAK